jgi:hypothetical protein
MAKQKRSTLLITLIFSLTLFNSSAQTDSSGLSQKAVSPLDSPEVNPVADSIVDYVLKNKDRGITDAIIIDGDTVPMVILDEVLFIPKPSFNNNEARRRYLILKKKVYRVYPWVVLAATNLDTLNARLNRIPSKRKRKKYIKEFQEYLEEEFEPDLRKLTRSEGQILCKLLYRETGITAFDLIKEYRSGWKAFWYNVSASFYDISLKKEYDPEHDDEDRLIENILLRAFNQGVLEERKKADIPRPDL